jgi:hypothetical protein
VAHSKNRGAESSTARGGGGRPISTVTDGKVGWGGALGLHGAVGKWLEAHRRGGLTGGVVSTGDGGEARRPMVVVGNSWFRKVVGTRAVVGVASTSRRAAGEA